MKAFEVYVNGDKVCTAGVAADGVLYAGSRCVAMPSGAAGLSGDVSALDRQAAEHLIWSVPSIRAGDEITIRTVETDTIDPPRDRKPMERFDP